MYYSAQIFLLGAEFTWVYAHVHGSRSNTAAEPARASGGVPSGDGAAAALARSRSSLKAAMQRRRGRT
jgi:membrane protein